MPSNLPPSPDSAQATRKEGIDGSGWSDSQIAEVCAALWFIALLLTMDAGFPVWGVCIVGIKAAMASFRM